MNLVDNSEVDFEAISPQFLKHFFVILMGPMINPDKRFQNAWRQVEGLA